MNIFAIKPVSDTHTHTHTHTHKKRGVIENKENYKEASNTLKTVDYIKFPTKIFAYLSLTWQVHPSSHLQTLIKEKDTDMEKE